MTVFDEATAVLPAGDGRYDVKPDERFAIVSGDGEQTFSMLTLTCGCVDC